MTKLLTLIKSAPITVASLVVVILSLGFFGWVWAKSGSFRASLVERGQQISQLESLKSETIQIPGAEPGDEPREITVPINPHTIEALSNLDTELEAEFKAVRNAALEHNRSGHTVLVEGTLPEPENPTKPIDAREAYKAMLPRLLQSPEAVSEATNDTSVEVDEQADELEDPNLAESTEEAVEQAKAQAAELPRLVVGMPPSQADLQQRIDQFEDDFRRSIFAANDERGLTREEVDRLDEQKRGRLREMLYSRAREVDVYASADPSSQHFPLQFAPLRNADPPQTYEVWEAQLELWIQQDIIKAIGLANDVSNPDASVLTAPVKHLRRIQVLPGYVGLHTRGGVVGGSSSMSAPYAQPENYTAPARTNIPRNFFVGPTGRVSNPVYDVRHIQLDLVVDYTQLPALFNALHRVNFMTVLKCEFNEVDEYQAYREGFVFGENADAVSATLVVESLWLRDWTGPLMPERVRQYLGIKEAYVSPDDEEGMGAAPMGP